jgi:hypothetical protein
VFKAFLIDTIVLNDGFTLMLNPELETLDMEKVFAFFFALKSCCLDGNLNEIKDTF